MHLAAETKIQETKKLIYSIPTALFSLSYCTDVQSNRLVLLVSNWGTVNVCNPTIMNN
jgi:hypothetical protein